jgi:hypothetical protein
MPCEGDSPVGVMPPWGDEVTPAVRASRALAGYPAVTTGALNTLRRNLRALDRRLSQVPQALLMPRGGDMRRAMDTWGTVGTLRPPYPALAPRAALPSPASTAYNGE